MWISLGGQKWNLTINQALLLGLDRTLNELINTTNADNPTTTALSLTTSTQISRLVNAQGGEYGNALRASCKGYQPVVQLLLDKRADVKLRGPANCRNALQAASSEGHNEVVRLLREKGVDFNAEGGKYGNALQAASVENHNSGVKWLMENGAQIWMVKNPLMSSMTLKLSKTPRGMTYQ